MGKESENKTECIFGETGGENMDGSSSCGRSICMAVISVPKVSAALRRLYSD